MEAQFVSWRLARTIPALLWMLGIFALSSQSQIPQALGISVQLLAIAGHLGAYGALSVLTAWGISVNFGRISQRSLAAWTVALVYGVTDEVHQSFVPGRYATMEDIVTNAIGAAAGLGVMLVLARPRADRATE